jgi:hypothetical protein
MTSLFAYRSYRDAPAAIAWLEAIGFWEVTFSRATTAQCCTPSSGSGDDRSQLNGVL